MLSARAGLRRWLRHAFTYKLLRTFFFSSTDTLHPSPHAPVGAPWAFHWQRLAPRQPSIDSHAAQAHGHALNRGVLVLRATTPSARLMMAVVIMATRLSRRPEGLLAAAVAMTVAFTIVITAAPAVSALAIGSARAFSVLMNAAATTTMLLLARLRRRWTGADICSSHGRLWALHGIRDAAPRLLGCDPRLHHHRGQWLHHRGLRRLLWLLWLVACSRHLTQGGLGLRWVESDRHGGVLLAAAGATRRLSARCLPAAHVQAAKHRQD